MLCKSHGLQICSLDDIVRLRAEKQRKRATVKACEGGSKRDERAANGDAASRVGVENERKERLDAIL